jgi:hypothetical protein
MKNKKYYLKNRDKEIISITIQESYDFALEYFTQTKKLDSDTLLKIYKIDESRNND